MLRGKMSLHEGAVQSLLLFSLHCTAADGKTESQCGKLSQFKDTVQKLLLHDVTVEM